MFIVLVPLHAGAEIYKSVDSEGNVVFSDQPTPGAKKILEQLTPTYVPTPLPQAAITTPVVASYYTVLRIRKPAAGETLRDAAGALTIDLEVVPSLNSLEGHILVVAVDGNNLASHDGTTQLTISNLAPGTHTLKAQIMDAAGQVQFSSDSVTFHMQRPANPSSTR
jgi:hypothetical protein